MPGWHGDHQSGVLAASYSFRKILQTATDILMYPPSFVIRLETLDEREETAARQLPFSQFHPRCMLGVKLDIILPFNEPI